MDNLLYIAIAICSFVLGYQYAVRKKRDQLLLSKPLNWHIENFHKYAKQDLIRQDEWNKAFDAVKCMNEKADQERKNGGNPGFL